MEIAHFLTKINNENRKKKKKRNNDTRTNEKYITFDQTRRAYQERQNVKPLPVRLSARIGLHSPNR